MSRGAVGARLLLLSPAVVAFLAAVITLAPEALADPAVLTREPTSAVQIGLGFALWGALFIPPVQRAVAGFWSRRILEVQDGMVRVEDRHLLGARRWQEPVANYLGVAHHIRTSLSGLRHEIVLVHENADRTVVLFAGESVSESQLESVRRVLGLSVVPARALYERPQQAGRPPVETVAKAWAHAVLP